MKKENDNLNKKLKQFSEKPSPEREYESLANTLKKIDIETSVLNKSGKKQTYTLLAILLGTKNYLVTGVTNKRSIGQQEHFLYFDICPRLQIHGLANNEKVASVQWRRFCLTSKGADFLAYMERKSSESKDD